MRSSRRVWFSCPHCKSTRIQAVRREEVRSRGVLVAWMEVTKCNNCGASWKSDRLTGWRAA